MSHKLLIDEPPLLVGRTLAKLIGYSEATVLQQIHYWVNKNIKNNGTPWVYNSYKQWQEQDFPFWCIKTIQRTIYNLEELKLLTSFIDDKNQTKYYTVNYEALSDLQKNPPGKDYLPSEETLGMDKLSTPPWTNCPPPLDKLSTPPWTNCPPPLDKLSTPYIDTETTTETTTESGENSETEEDPLSVFSKNASPQKVVKKEKRERGSRLSKDWELPAEWRSYAIWRGMPEERVDEQAAAFKDHWVSTTKNPTKLDWEATWRTWCRNFCDWKNIPLPKPETKATPVATSVVAKKNSSDPQIQKWYDLQGSLEERVGSDQYQSWLSNLEVIEISDKAVFRVRNNFIKDYISQRFLDDICACLGMSDEKVKFIVPLESSQRPLNGD